jgi:hypothetical protein
MYVCIYLCIVAKLVVKLVKGAWEEAAEAMQAEMAPLE